MADTPLDLNTVGPDGPPVDLNTLGIKPARGALSEIGMGALRGVLAGAPEGIGKTLQFMGADQAGGALRQFGEGMAQQPWLAARPEGHGMVTNTLAGAAEGVGSFAPVIAAGAVNPLAGLALGAEQMAGTAGQDTLEKAQAKGVSPEAAETAAKLNSMQSFAMGLAGGAVAGKTLGVLGGAVGRAVGIEGTPLAEGLLNDLTGQSGVLKPLARQLPISAAENTAIMAGQAGLQAGIEQHYGIDDTDPLSAMAGSIGPSLGLTAITGGGALAARAMGVRSAVARTGQLADGNSAPEIRTQLADQYAAALAKVDPQKAAIFRANAQTAIDHRMGVPVDPSLFQPGAVYPDMQGPVQPGSMGPAGPAGPNPVTAQSDVPLLPAPQPFVLPNGQVASSPEAVEAYINSFPEDQRVAKRAEIYGYGAQPAGPDVPPAEAPPAPPLLLTNTGVRHEPMVVNSAGVAWPKGKEFQFPDGATSTDPTIIAAFLSRKEPVTALVPAEPAVTVGPDGTAMTPEQRAAYDAMTPEQQAAARTHPNALSPAGNAPRALPAPTVTVDSEGRAMSAADRNAYAAMTPAEQAATSPQSKAWHEQIRQELTDGGETPAAPLTRAGFAKTDAAAGLKGQKLAKAYEAYLQAPATHVELMRQDAEQYMAMKERQAAEDAARANEPAPALNPLVDESRPVDERTNTQVPDALTPVASALRNQQLIDERRARGEAWKGNENEALARQARGEQLADAAEAGTVPPDLNGPKTAMHIGEDVDSVLAANSETPLKQDVARLKVKINDLAGSKATHAEQIDALQAYLDDPKTRQSALKDRVAMVLKSWRDALPQPEEAKPAEAKQPDQTPVTKANGTAAPGLTAAPTQADSLGTNIEKAAPATAEPSPGTAEVMNSLPSNTTRSPKQQVTDMLTRVQAVLADFHTRNNNGAPIKDMSDLEKRRYNDAVAYKNTLAAIQRGETTMPGADYLKSMQEMVGDTEQPYTKLERRAAPDTPDAMIAGKLAWGNATVHDMMRYLSESGSTPAIRDIAARLHALGLDTTISSATIPTQPGRPPTTGRYSPPQNRIEINAGHETEATVLHEAVHAALFHMTQWGLEIGTPRTQAEARVKRAVQDFEDIRNKALEHTGADPIRGQYGLTNAHEFGAELLSNPEFQDYLKGLRADGGKRSLWSRAIDAVRRMFGMPVEQGNALGKAMDAASVLMDAAKNSREFDASPQGAVKATDATLNSFAKLADRVPVDLRTTDRGVFRSALGFKTVDFIAHQLDVWPAMVKSGLAEAANQFRAARDSRRITGEHLSQTLGKYSADVQRTLRATGDPRGWGEKMMRVAGSSAIGQFDYRKNFADNNKPVDQGGGGRQLDPDMKAHVDEIHRQFKQLEQAQPELARALVDGEKQNRKMLIQQVATLASNLIGAHTGVVPRLEAELARLPLEDKNRAALMERIQLAQLDATFAAKHMRGLDFMGEDLKTARNGLPDVHLDGASSALGARLSAMFKEAAELPQGTSLKGPLAELSRIYTPQVRNPYFSLGRSGDHYVNIAFKGPVNAQTVARLNEALAGTNKVLGNLDNQTHAFFRVDTLDQAQGLFQKLIAAGGTDALDVPASSRGRLAATDMQSAAGISPAIRQLVGALNDAVDMGTINAGQQVDMKQALTRTLLSMLPETAARSAKMERRGVPGYDGDFAANFAKRASGAVQDLSNAYTNRAFGAAQTAMKDAAERMRMGNSEATPDEASRGQSVVDELNRRYADGMKPLDNTPVNLMNAFSHTFYLAISPAFLIRTMAQPYHRGLPILGARYGFVNAAKEVAGGTGTAIKIIGNTIRQGWDEEGGRGVLNTGMRFDNLGLSKADAAFMQEMHDRGVFKLGQAQQLQHAITGATQRQQDAARIASMTAQYAEMTNRVAVGLAAFRMAMKDPKITDMDARTKAATDWAHTAINNAMDNFDADNTARQIGKHGFAGKVTPLLTNFMNYNLQTMQQIARTVQDGYFSKGALPGESAQDFADRKKYAQREFMGLMATTALISGAMGLPFVNAFAGVYNTMRQIVNPDDPDDIRGDVRNWLTSTFGDGAGDIIAHGVGHLVNADTSTFGLENLLPGSEFLASRQKLQDRLESQSQQLLGPAINAGLDIMAGAGKIIDGNYVKGIEAMLPSGLKPYYKAAELATNGYTNSRGLPLPMDAGPWDIGLQLAGFRTAEKANRDERQHEFDASQALLSARREVLSDRLFRGVVTNDVDAQQSAQSAIQDFSAANPYQPMRGMGSSIARHMQELAIGNALGYGVPLSKRQIAPALKAFGGMPGGE